MGNFQSIEARSDELLTLYDEIFLDEPHDLANSLASDVDLESGPGEKYDTDEALIAAISRSKQGKKFMDLFDQGDLSYFNQDHSSADGSLVSTLAFWLGNDTERIDRLFRKSALMRPKWNCH